MSLLLDAIKKAEQSESKQSATSKEGDGLPLDESSLDSVELTIDEDLLEPSENNAAKTQPAQTVDYVPDATESLDNSPLSAGTPRVSENPLSLPVNTPVDDTAKDELGGLTLEDEPADALDQYPASPDPEPVAVQEHEQAVIADIADRESGDSDQPPALESPIPDLSTDAASPPDHIALEDESSVETAPTIASQRKRNFSPVRLAVLLLIGLVIALLFYYLTDPATNSATPQAQVTDRGATSYHLAVDSSLPDPATPEDIQVESEAATAAAVPPSARTDAAPTNFLLQPVPENANEPLVDQATLTAPTTASNDYLEPATGENLIIQRQSNSAGPTAMNLAQVALDNGDFNEAERLYEQWLTQRPYSTAARFGLARLSLLQGEVDQARLMYLDILQIEPTNSTAQASLINLPGTGSPESLRRLQFLLKQNSDDPYLNYVMGNQQARLTRWREAQKYYFQAAAVRRDNAIYAFNLAIALDHLQKPAAAASYYRRALELTNPPLGDAHRLQVISRLDNIANSKGQL